MLRYINKNRFEKFVLVFYLSVSPISKLLAFFGVSRLVTYFIMLIFVFLYIVWTLNKCTVDILIFYGIFIPLILYGIFENGKYIESKTNIYAIFISFFLSYYIFRTLDLDYCLNNLRTAAYINLTYYFIEALLNGFNSDNYMSYAYHIQFFLCVIFYFALYKKKYIDIILFIFGIFTMLFFGARGALVGTVCFLLYVLYLKVTKKRILFGLTCVFLITVFLVSSKEVLVLMEKFGINSRTLEKLVTGEFFVSSSRSNLYNICLSLISENPLGYGILSSRKLLKHYTYPHSLLFELQIDYGFALGGIIFFLIIITVIHLILKRSESERKIVFALFCILGISMLLVSSSLYYEFYIPAIIALFFNELKRNGREEGDEK